MIADSKSRRNEVSFMLYANNRKGQPLQYIAFSNFFYQTKSSHEKLFMYTFMC